MARRRRSRSIGSEFRAAGGADPAAGPRAVRDTRAAKPTARDVAIRLLARAPRTTVEIEGALARRRFDPAVIAETLGTLRDHRYVDDDALARRRAEDLLLRRGQGRLRVAHELTRRGVADTVVDAAIAAVLEGRRDAELARLALRRKFGEDPLHDRTARARAYRFLVGRGHPPEAVSEILGDDDSR
jgi:regulatory protein